MSKKARLSPEDLFSEVHKSDCIAALFDSHLNYVHVNQAACDQLHVQQHDLVGKCIVDLYPRILASSNHRNLLRALAGEFIHDAIIDSGKGDYFKTTYIPVYMSDKSLGILVRSTKVQRVQKKTPPAVNSAHEA